MFGTAGATDAAPVSDRAAGRSEPRSRFLRRPFLRYLVAAVYVALLSGYGYWVAASGYQPPPSLERIN